MANRLVSAERMQANLDYARAEGMLIVGSLGRAAAFNALGQNPALEFEMRGVPILGTPARPRDADTIGGSLEEWLPHDSLLDPGMFSELITEENGVWKITSRKQEVTAAPWVFAATEGRTVLDMPCLTVRPATHLLLLEPARPKRYLAVGKLLYEAMPPDEQELLRTPEAKAVRRVLFALFGRRLASDFEEQQYLSR